MTAQVTKLFDNIWQQYIAVTPSADSIRQLLANGGDVINDHVAYRTFNLEKVNLNKLAQHLLTIGYTECGQYDFAAKKLTAKHFEHNDSSMPKVFISELRVEELSTEIQAIIHKLVDQLPEDISEQQGFLYSGRPWQISSVDYQTLLATSEYAAWLAAWGYRANHFTVSINHLESFDCIVAVNNSLKQAGYTLNSTGGEVKGDEVVKLEQSSTLADKALVEFSDKSIEIPSCFYEFAKRYPLTNGQLYTGFVAASADKIFESTNAVA
ncbi:succinyldiaminopimelate aminotransferase [Colwellia sp. 39_35_sub15_T18]|nr:succinyldiaminopimelate aminotransferase [Colwellia sp. 39_35_sub15_T18]